MIARFTPPTVALASLPHRVEVRAGPRHPWTLAAELPDRAAAVREVQARLRTHTCACIRVRPAPVVVPMIGLNHDEIAIMTIASKGALAVHGAAQRLGNASIAATRSRATEAVARLVGAELLVQAGDSYVLTQRGRVWAVRHADDNNGKE